MIRVGSRRTRTKEGEEKYKDFFLTQYQEIDELQVLLREFTHRPSGAQIIHIEAKDQENFFSLCFPTHPSDDQGIPHILEHIAFSGSEKYRVKDLLFSMLKRSVATFMNAFTGPDYTCYLASSTIKKDFFNLLKVYIETAFHPLLKEEAFWQEGHRLTIKDEKLTIDGVVFNEMKGALAAPQARLWAKMMRHLFPSLPYAYNAGGDPAAIPLLTYEKLRDFYQTFYHPSRCLFFFYGDIPHQEILDFLGEEILFSDTLALPKLSPIGCQKALAKQKIIATYPIAPHQKAEGQTMIGFGWATIKFDDPVELLALCTLDIMLMESDASPLRKALIQSPWIKQTYSMLEKEMSHIPYLIVCKGVPSDKADEIESLLFETLQKIKKQGFTQEALDSAIHQLELGSVDIGSSGEPFGLTLFLRAGLYKQQGGDPRDALAIHAQFDLLKKQAEDPLFFPNLIEKYFISNEHYVRLEMQPDPTLAEQEEQREATFLSHLSEKLSKEERRNLKKAEKRFEKYAQEDFSQGLAALPHLTLKDIPQEVVHIPLEKIAHRDGSLFIHETCTNEVLYADLIFDCPSLTEEELPYLSLLLAFFTEVGSKKRSHEELLNAIQASTGGISASFCPYPSKVGSSLLKPAIHISGKALYRNSDKLLLLIKELLHEVDYSHPDRLEMLIKQLHQNLETRLERKALSYAIKLAKSNFEESGIIEEHLSGLSFVKLIRTLYKDLKNQRTELSKKLIQLYHKVFTLQSPHLVLCCNATLRQKIEREGCYGLLDAPQSRLIDWKFVHNNQKIHPQGKTIAAPVAFNVQGLHAPDYTDPLSPAAAITASLLEQEFLLPAIREQGGAYGAGAGYQSSQRFFYLYSHNDPQITRTHQCFLESIQKVSEGLFSQKAIEAAIIGTIQELDSPIPKGARATTAYSWWRTQKTEAQRAAYKQKILTTSKSEIVALAQQWCEKKEEALFISFANKALFDKQENLPLENFPVTPV